MACEELERAAVDPRAIRLALARWVAPVLQEFADESWAVADARRLDERREQAVEDLADALIAHHRADEAVAVLEPHVIVRPYPDWPRGLLIRALAGAGRQTEALRVFQTYPARPLKYLSGAASAFDHGQRGGLLVARVGPYLADGPSSRGCGRSVWVGWFERRAGGCGFE